MSITDELRESVKQTNWAMTSKAKWFAIADRIDAEHEKAVQEKSIRVYTSDADMEHDGWVRLPKDADGAPIHIGDVMDSRVDYLFDGKPFTVRALILYEDGWEVADGRFGNRYEPDSLRHRHEPTVEDVLDEFASAYDRIGGEDEEHQKYLDLIAEYAAKLQLKERK